MSPAFRYRGVGQGVGECVKRGKNKFSDPEVSLPVVSSMSSAGRKPL